MTEDDVREPIAYEDGEYVVLCDRGNPTAWIRSDTVVAVGSAEVDRARSTEGNGGAPTGATSGD